MVNGPAHLECNTVQLRDKENRQRLKQALREERNYRNEKDESLQR